MAHFAFIDGVATINSVALSAHCRSVDVTLGLRMVEDGPCMGQTDIKSLPALRETGPIRLVFKNDFAAAQVYATLFPLWQNKTAFTYDVKPTSGADSATNPRLNGTGYLSKFTPLKGGFGDVPEVEVEITPGGSQPDLQADVT